MKLVNRKNVWLILLLCFVIMAGMPVLKAEAVRTDVASPTGKCTNATNEGIEFYINYKADASEANNWRTDIEVTPSLRSNGAPAGEIAGVEMALLNLSTRYQCTEIAPGTPAVFSCNSLPAGASISGIYVLYKPQGTVADDTILKFDFNVVTNQLALLSSDAVVKYPPFPCSRNYKVKDFIPDIDEKLVYNTASCAEHKTVQFLEPKDEFAIVNIIPGDTIVGSRLMVDVSPDVNYNYKLHLIFQDANANRYEYIQAYDAVAQSYNVEKNDLDGAGLGQDDLPLTLLAGSLTDFSAPNKDLWKNPDYPTSTDFNIKVWYENTEGTLGYENSVFHFERNLNIQLAPYCTANSGSNMMTGVAESAYDQCGDTGQLFYASLVDERTNPQGVIVPRSMAACLNTYSHYCTDNSAVSVSGSEPSKTTVYRFLTRKCADASCSSVVTTNAYPYSVTVSDGLSMSRTWAASRSRIYHTMATRVEISMKAYGNTNARPFAITGVRMYAEEPGTYVVYGFVPSSDYEKRVPDNYAVKFYITIPESDSLMTCSTLANNGYFRAYWNDCLSPKETQLMPFEHLQDQEEAWIRNTSAHGIHFPYVSEWSYVPQQLEVASLTCKFEALTRQGRPGDGYCRPDDVYVPPYTKVTITGGTIYLNSSPAHDQYFVAYAREETYNISHLFFELRIKECENVKKIPDTGISLRSPLKKVDESVDAATSYVFTGNSIRIPAIGLGTGVPIPIVHVYYEEGSTDLGWDLSTLGNYVGELEGGSYLPYPGNSALTGHYYSMGVFKNLEYLKEGDEIIIFGNDGIRYTYQVVQKFIAQPTDVYEMFQQVGERSLTLVTCENYNMVTDEYERRQIIRATIIGQEPYTQDW